MSRVSCPKSGAHSEISPPTHTACPCLSSAMHKVCAGRGSAATGIHLEPARRTCRVESDRMRRAKSRKASTRDKKRERSPSAFVYQDRDSWVAVVEGQVVASADTQEAVERAATSQGYRTRALAFKRAAWTKVPPRARWTKLGPRHRSWHSLRRTSRPDGARAVRMDSSRVTSDWSFGPIRTAP